MTERLLFALQATSIVGAIWLIVGLFVVVAKEFGWPLLVLLVLFFVICVIVGPKEPTPEKPASHTAGEKGE